MKRGLSALLAALVCLGAYAILERGARAAGVCPAFGADTDCGTIITLATSGSTLTASLTNTGQGPYDGNDDTLLGVVNNSNQPLTTLGLTSGNTLNGGIFAFDGDGITTYGASGNAQDPTGYGGPNAYFTNINASYTGGTVNFITPIAAGGGTAYFSLENALSQAYTCAQVVNNAVTGPTLSGPGGALTATQIRATFKPNLGLTISQAAGYCGFTDFDWQQTITNLPTPSPFFQVGNPTALFAPPSFLDPPPGGYTYESPADNANPYYYDPYSGELAGQETTTTLSFYDAPADPCLPGGTGGPCGGQTAPAGSSIAFTTHLVGVTASGPVDLGIGFNWTSNFNGTAGGIATTKTGNGTDAGSGTGGITKGTVTTTTTYSSGIVVTGANGGGVVFTGLTNTVFIPLVANNSSGGQLQVTSPVRPGVAKPTPTSILRLPIGSPDRR
jgi:hypothetical protein